MNTEPLPAPIVVEHEGYAVVRDDLLPGGAKRRVIQPLVAASSYREFVYASPAYGYAQVALAYACAATGKSATIFTAKRKATHRLTLAAKQAGARVFMVPYGYLSNVQAKARKHAQDSGAYYVPFGVDTEESIDGIAAAARLTGLSPREVWTVSGSGTLIRGLQRAFPGASFHTVIIGKRDANVGIATPYYAPEKFEDDARHPPPWPSSSNYDAKLWRFARKHAAPGALIWNVGA